MLKAKQGTDPNLGPLSPGVEDTKNGEHTHLDVFFWGDSHLLSLLFLSLINKVERNEEAS